MEKIENERIEEVTEASESERLVKTGLKTLYCAFVALALFMFLFVVLFPYQSMKLYMRLGNKVRALESADGFYKLHENDYGVTNAPSYDSKFADVLYAGINLSSEMLNAEADKGGFGSKKLLRYASAADRFSSCYLSYSSLETRTAITDNYSLSHFSPSVHASVYSFENTVSVLREKSRFLLRGNAYSLGYFYDEFSDGLLQNNDTFGFDKENTPDEVDAYVCLFNQLSGIIEYELDAIGYYDNVKFNKDGYLIAESLIDAKLNFDGTQFGLLYLREPLKISDGGQTFSGKSPILKWASSSSQLVSDPRGLEYWMPQFIDYIDGYVPLTRSDAARRLYWAKSVADLTDRIASAFTVMEFRSEMYNQNQKDEIYETRTKWDSINYHDFGDGNKSVAEWYRFELVPGYAALYAEK